MRQASSDLPVRHAVPETPQSFAALGLSTDILRSLNAVGFHHPTPIQAAVIPIALQGNDLIGCALTGTGKTAAFVLPLAERLSHGKGVRAVILSPTREIALQTHRFIELFGERHQLTATILIGGVKINPQIRELKKHPDILVATPGRLNDHLERKTISLNAIECVVFDEADRMLDMGFLPQIAAIMRHVPQDRQTMMFSATMAPDIRQLANRYLRNPQMIDLVPEKTTAAGISHRLYLVDPMDKRKLLLKLMESEQGTTLIFTRMRQDVDRLARFLEVQTDETIARLHADRTQKERTQALDDFRDGRCRILIATDIAARGLDIPHIAHVIHFDIPENAEDYIHRSGRTARYFGSGIASVIGTWMEKVQIDAIEKTIGEKLERSTMEGITAFVERHMAPLGRLRPKTRRRPRR